MYTSQLANPKGRPHPCNLDQLMRSNLVHTSRVIRAARKLHGKTQKEVAGWLGITQAGFSKMENGRSTPDVEQWFHLCRAFGIQAEDSFNSGYIDRGMKIGTSSERSHAFKVPTRYMRNMGSQVRANMPFIKFLEHKAGPNKFDEYCRYLKIDPDFFIVYDNQLNMRFSLDLATWLIQSGNLKREHMGELTRTVNRPEMHGNLHAIYHHIGSKKALVRSRIENIGLYEINADYAFVDESPESLTLSITPNHRMKQFNYKNSTLGSFVCDYKKEYIQYFCTYTGGAPAHIEETECHFRGERRCLYKIHLET